MTERPKFFDDLAGVAGGAMSALAGLREEAEGTLRARVEEMIRKLDLVRREDLEAVQEMAANARAAQADTEARLAALEARLAAMSAAGSTASSSAAATASASAEPVLPATPAPPRPGDSEAEGSPS
ncbi:MAG: accessory factor UbiK family protein [Acetobacteraceae bacterium]|nr:accessory factor UbiK family protein [Acetobacteraceae bacterium]